MKKAYEKPTIEITEFEVEDIMGGSTLSNGGDGGFDLFINWDQIE